MACAGIAAGYLIGRQSGAGRSSSVSAKSGDGSPQELAANGTANSNAATAVKGRITYKNDEGDSRPDRKARVLVFPQQREGQRKLDITGFRGGDAAEDFRSAAAAFHALGGGASVVNDDGSFEISLPAAGTYHILVLSNYQPRDTDETTDGPLMNLLAQYFDRPEQLLGRVAYHFGQVRYKGAEPVLWDHSF
ncbi:MAG: hypothetical protein IH897_08175 [Planctomycetes bacterium]|nr:hypothetical protein [Planctomycetota bacterium]